MRALHHKKFTPLTLVAIASVILLVAVILWQVFAPLHPAPVIAAGPGSEEPVADPLYQQEMILLGLATSTAAGIGDGSDPVELIAPQVLAQLLGKYTNLVQAGIYNETTGAEAAAEIAPHVRALVTYVPFKKSDIKTSADVSYEGMLAYRSAMQEALKPLLANTRAEYAIYGAYIESGDIEELDALVRSANNYQDAAAAAIKVVVPQDAADLHLELVNALAHFSATLNALALHANDPIGSVALLRTYNDTEYAVVNSFSKFAAYSKSKQL